VLIQASLNGGTTRAEHPAVPLTPAELAAEARAAAAAGARSIHVHPRDLSGAQTLRPEHVLAAVAAVRAAAGLPVGVTTGIWAVDGDVSRRMSLVADWSGRDRPDFASINMNEPGTDALADLLTAQGIEIEELRYEVEGDLDLHRFLGLGGPRAGFSAIRARGWVRSPNATKEQLDDLSVYVENTSPVRDILAAAVPVTTELVVMADGDRR